MVFEKLTERLIIKGEIISQTPLHIGSGKKDLEIDDVDAPIITDTSLQAYIPGSSIKGKVRSEAERIARQNGQPVCNPPNVMNMCGAKERTDLRLHGEHVINNRHAILLRDPLQKVLFEVRVGAFRDKVKLSLKVGVISNIFILDKQPPLDPFHA